MKKLNLPEDYKLLIHKLIFEVSKLQPDVKIQDYLYEEFLANKIKINEFPFKHSEQKYQSALDLLNLDWEYKFEQNE